MAVLYSHMRECSLAVRCSRYLRGMAEHSTDQPNERPPAKQPLDPPPPQHPAVTREATEIAEQLSGLAAELVAAAAARVADEAEAPQGAAAAGLYYEVRRDVHELLRQRGRTALDEHLADRRANGVSERRATGEVQRLAGLGRYAVLNSAFGPRWVRRGPGERGDSRDLG